MRVSPLAVWGWRLQPEQLADFAAADARLSHPHPVCQQASAIFAVAIAAAIRDGLAPQALHALALGEARRLGAEALEERLLQAASAPPDEVDGGKMGWVRIALHNAFHQLLTAPSVEEGLARTVALGGDTDTNAAIAGALLGAVHGARSLPLQWVDRVLTCRPLAGEPGVHRPRPRWCWPVDALFLAERLVSLGARAAAPAAR